MGPFFVYNGIILTLGSVFMEDFGRCFVCFMVGVFISGLYIPSLRWSLSLIQKSLSVVTGMIW